MSVTQLRALLPVLLAMLLLSCNRRESIVVGAKAFTEGYLLGHMAEMLLEDAGFEVDEQFGVASAAMRSALESGQIDLYYEYTGTAYTVYAGGTDPAVMSDSARVLAAVRTYDSAEHGLRWLAPIPFNDTYTLLMRRRSAQERKIGTLSALAAAVNAGTPLTIAVDAEFFERPDGLKALLARYRFPGARVLKLDAGLAYQALVDGKVDVAMGYSTDGRISAYDLISLEDDLRFFPAYNPAAVVRAELLARHPEIASILERLNARLTTDVIRRLNAEVDQEHHDPRNVARRWLVETGLIHAR
jgi:osmoprotectant transport system substrate-binding protein